jgi:cytochrome P450
MIAGWLVFRVPSTMSRSFHECLAAPGFAADPFPFLRVMREENPVQWSESGGCWVLTCYENVREVLQDARRFSNRGRITGLFNHLYTPAQLVELQPLISHYAHGLINVDPPDHTRMRRILHGVFRPSIIQLLRDRIQAAVDRLFDAAAPSGRLDFIQNFSHPLPVSVIAELFGIPPEDVPFFAQWSHGIVAFQHHAAPPFEVTLGSQRALLELRAYLRDAIAQRRVRPTEDVLGLMVRATDEGDQLSEEEILGTSVTILNGGHETTTRLLGTVVVDLARHPAERDRLRTNPALMESAVEEFLRFSGPFQRDARVCKEATVIRGQTIKSGDHLLLLLGAANRDPEQFPDPDRFDVTREPNRHLAFGFGPHICLGAPLARLETSIAIGTLLRRFPYYRLASENIEWNFGFVWGPREVPLLLG